MSACNGADNGARTRDPNLGKVVLYQLSHVRFARNYYTLMPKRMQEKKWNVFGVWNAQVSWLLQAARRRSLQAIAWR